VRPARWLGLGAAPPGCAAPRRPAGAPYSLGVVWVVAEARRWDRRGAPPGTLAVTPLTHPEMLAAPGLQGALFARTPWRRGRWPRAYAAEDSPFELDAALDPRAWEDGV
jgi:hypothetical protein